MDDRRGIRLVIEREVREALRRKALWFISAFALAAMTAIVVLPTVLGSSDEPYHVGVVGRAGDTLTATLRSAAAAGERKVDISRSPDVAAARQAVRDGDLDAAVVVGEQTALVVQQSTGELVTTLREVVAADRSIEALKAAGLSDSQITWALTPPNVKLDVVDADRNARITAATVIAIAVYLLLLLVTMQVAQGVAIEKANRVSEVLLAIVPARTMLLGKVAGVGLIALVPLVAGALPVVIRLTTSDSLPPGTGAALGAGAAWFVLGAGFYLLAAGALGALVDRQEDVGSTIAVLSIVIVGSYLVAQSAPDSPLGAVMAYLPFSAPMVEPARLALGVSSLVEVLGSLIIGALSVVVMARVATTVYQRAVVHTGSRLHLREVLRSST